MCSTLQGHAATSHTPQQDFDYEARDAWPTDQHVANGMPTDADAAPCPIDVQGIVQGIAMAHQPPPIPKEAPAPPTPPPVASPEPAPAPTGLGGLGMLPPRAKPAPTPTPAPSPAAPSSAPTGLGGLPGLPPRTRPADQPPPAPAATAAATPAATATPAASTAPAPVAPAGLGSVLQRPLMPARNTPVAAAPPPEARQAAQAPVVEPEEPAHVQKMRRQVQAMRVNLVRCLWWCAVERGGGVLWRNGSAKKGLVFKETCVAVYITLWICVHCAHIHMSLAPTAALLCPTRPAHAQQHHAAGDVPT